MTQTETFGDHLRDLRTRRGLSMAQLLDRTAPNSDEHKVLSRSGLNAIENGTTTFVKPEVMRALADALDIPVERLVEDWIASTYGVHFGTAMASNQSGRVDLKLSDMFHRGLHAYLDAEGNEVTVTGIPKADTATDYPCFGENAAPESLSIVTLEEFREIQGALPAHSRVFVAASDFLEDDVFYGMVLNNYRKPVKYYYFLENPEQYSLFVKRVEATDWDVKKQGPLHNNITFYLRPRFENTNQGMIPPQFQFPLNCVLLEHISRGPQAFIGMMVENRPAFYQIADQRLTARIQNSFRLLGIADV